MAAGPDRETLPYADCRSTFCPKGLTDARSTTRGIFRLVISLVTEQEAQPGIKVRALVDYCDRFGCPFGAIGTIVGRSDFGDEQHLTIRWELPGERRDIIGGASISRGELAGLYVVES